MVGFDELGEGAVDVLNCVLGHALELTRKGQLTVLVADSHRQDHHFKYYINIRITQQQERMVIVYIFEGKG